MRKRLREAMSREEMRQVYSTPHDHTRWADHVNRAEITVALGKSVANREVVADLSCGSGYIATELATREAILGDFAPGYPIKGRLDKTLRRLKPGVNLYVCSETLEHMDDPELILRLIRSDTLLLSTPVGAMDDDNPEHYWAWDREDVEDMLSETGWIPNLYVSFDTTMMGGVYTFGIWTCSRCS